MTIQNATDYRNAHNVALDARIAYETEKSAVTNSVKILSTLADIRKSTDHDAIAAIMFVSNVDANTINRSERSNARFNVYSYQKIVNIARAAMKVATLNHYSRAIIATAKTLRDNDMMLTHEDAQCACSLNVKHRDAKRAKLVTRYEKHVDVNTASTQSSSSINALQAFGILRETRDAANRVCYVLTDCEASERLLSTL